MMRYLVLIVCFIFAYLRFTMPIVSKIHPEDIFKDVAHLWTGGLFGAAGLATSFYFWQRARIKKRSPDLTPGDINIVPTVNIVTLGKFKSAMILYWVLGLVMTFAVEVVAFIVNKP